MSRQLDEPVGDQLLNKPMDVVRRTSLGRTTVFDLIARGEIESVKVGRSRLIPEEALRGFVARLREQQSNEAA